MATGSLSPPGLLDSLTTPALLLAGPTASGKSAAAILLAERLRGEIVSVDSMQVYRGMDIGTAKPTAEMRARVPHHLIDIVDLSTPFDAAQFVRAARESVQGIAARGNLPILCGGTGLYFKALLHGLGDAPAASQVLRKELEAVPLAKLLDELSDADPATYERIDRNNRRRVVRAIEVIRLTGKPFSGQRADWKVVGNSILSFGLKRETSDLRRRIDARVDEMFRRGLVAETEELLKLGLANNQTAMQALGYRQVVEHMRGAHSLEDTIELVKIRTRQFAKRQMTWFRRQPDLQWADVKPEEEAGIVADRVGVVWEDFRSRLPAGEATKSMKTPAPSNPEKL
jgi:tRNA dimethylallyltransferase